MTNAELREAIIDTHGLMQMWTSGPTRDMLSAHLQTLLAIQAERAASKPSGEQS